MTAKFKTKSNYRNLNGTLLNVKECVGTRVTCLVDFNEGFGIQEVDFNIFELIELNTK